MLDNIVHTYEVRTNGSQWIYDNLGDAVKNFAKDVYLYQNREVILFVDGEIVVKWTSIHGFETEEG